MIKKSSILILIFILVSNLFVSTTYAEQVQNIKDCLEQNEDCLEQDEQDSLVDSSNEENLTNERLNETSFFFNIVKMIFALLLILALIFFLSKLFNKKNNNLHQLNIMENMGGISVGQNKSIQIVRIGTQFYVVGVGENIELLKEITDENLQQELLQNETEAVEFKSLFQSLLNRGKSPDENQKETRQPFLTSLSKELEKIKKGRRAMVNENESKKDDGHE